jgi:hypothetical protein
VLRDLIGVLVGQITASTLDLGIGSWARRASIDQDGPAAILDQDGSGGGCPDRLVAAPHSPFPPFPPGRGTPPEVPQPSIVTRT